MKNAAFDDPWFSDGDGLAEARHVFLSGNRIPERLGATRPFSDFRVAELGFGSGLNLLAFLMAATVNITQQVRLSWYTVDIEFMPEATRRSLLVEFTELQELLEPFFSDLSKLKPEQVENGTVWRGSVGGTHWPHIQGRLVPEIALVFFQGDCSCFEKALPALVDAWLMDGHSPDKNPAMWDQAICDAMARHSGPGTTVATYSAAGLVKTALRAAGFSIVRRPGYGRKRHMVCGSFATNQP